MKKSSVTILAIDTSTHYFSLAVVCDSKILASRHLRLKKVLSSSIIPCIQNILIKAKVSLARLDGFAVGLGPGSFTSLRVGLATIKGLALATKKPVVGIPSLDILAMNVAGNQLDVCAIIDAKRNLVYNCFYQKKNGILKRTSRYLLTTIDDVLQRCRERETVFIGDAIAVFGQEIKKFGGGKMTSPGQWYPRAGHLASLAFKRFHQKRFDDPAKLVPLYLYPEDCQVYRP